MLSKVGLRQFLTLTIKVLDTLHILSYRGVDGFCAHGVCKFDFKGLQKLRQGLHFK